MKPWSDMTPRERDILTAREVMGQVDFAHPGFFWSEGHTDDGSDGWEGFYCPRCNASNAEQHSPCVRPYTASLDNASIVEQEIARRGLQDEYANALVALKPDSDWITSERWFLATATAEQRCHAACRAVGVEV